MDSIKSRERVKEHGEVFTPDSIVNKMLDMIDTALQSENKQAEQDKIWDYIDKTYLEPACGNGNFLVRILDRKLEAVQKLPLEQQTLGLLHSLCTIYAVDIQKDNVIESRERLLKLIKTGDTPLLELDNKEKIPFHFSKIELTPELEKTVNYILESNIQHGNCLTGKQWDGFNETDKDLLITEYIWDKENVARNKIALNNLIKENNLLYNQVEQSYSSVHYLSLANSNEQTQETVEDDEFDF